MEGPNQQQQQQQQQITPEAYLQAMRERMERALRLVAQAVNDAPDGAWINGSEWQVFHEFEDLRRDAYERALQMRADAADAADAAASAFPPDGPVDGPRPAGQDQQGP